MILPRRGLLTLAMLVLPASAGAESEARLETLGDSLETLLTDNLIPFWYPGVVDLAHGGYRLNHDSSGRYLGTAAKQIDSQAGTLWFFARLARSPFGTEQHLAAARHGFEFLRDHMWDHESEDSSGKSILRPWSQINPTKRSRRRPGHSTHCPSSLWRRPTPPRRSLPQRSSGVWSSMATIGYGAGIANFSDAIGEPCQTRSGRIPGCVRRTDRYGRISNSPTPSPPIIR